MTIKDIKERVIEIQIYQDDCDKAHLLEDKLFEDVLRAIKTRPFSKTWAKIAAREALRSKIYREEGQKQKEKYGKKRLP